MDNWDDLNVAIKRLNEAAYTALRACNRMKDYPAVNRQLVLGVARVSDDLVDAGIHQVV